MIRRIIAAALLSLGMVGPALAQTSPGLRQGQIPTATQWNGYFSSKQDYLGATPLLPNNVTGTSPIVVTPGGGVIAVACPTCSTGGSDFVDPAEYPTAQDAANAAGSKILLLRPGDSVSVAVPGTYATCTVAMAAISRWQIPQGSTVTVSYTGHISHTTCLVDRPDADRIKHRPAVAPLSTTMSSVASVTYSAGNTSVTANLASASGIAVGDVVRITNVVPGVGPPGSYAGYPAIGALQMAFYKTGGLTTGYLKTVGTAATVWQDAACTATAATAVSTFIHNNDLVTVRGQVRSISGVSGAGFTLSSAFTTDIPCMQYWYNLPNAGSGTVSISGGTVTGTSTFFLRDYNVNDIIFVDGGGTARISAISANSGAGAITLDRTLPNVTTANYGVMVSGELHSGSWVVTAINVGGNPNRITWKNTVQNALATPPVNAGLSGAITADVQVLTTVLSHTSNSNQGFVVQNGVLDIDQIAVAGTGTATTSDANAVGIDLRGTDHNSPDNIAAIAGWAGGAKLGPSMSILNFGYNLKAQGNPDVCWGRNVHFTGGTVGGVFMNFGPQCDFDSGVIAGNVDVNLYVGPGAAFQGSNLINHGSGGDCLSMIDAARGSYSEFAYYIGCGAVSVRYDGNSMFHNNGARHIKSTSGCIQSDNGGFGRMTGSLLINCGGTAVSFANAVHELSQSNILANVTGVISNNSRLNIANVGVGNSTSNAFRALQSGVLTGYDTFGAAIFGPVCGEGVASCVLIEQGSKGYLPSMGIATASATVTTTGGSYVRVKGYTGTPAFSPATVNRLDSDGNMIDNGSASTYSISGQTIDASPIGGGTPAAGAFTTLTKNGNSVVAGTDAAGGALAGTYPNPGLSGASMGRSMTNGTLVPSVSGNALTIAIKTLAGTDPSATDPVYIVFRNVSATSGNYVVITLTAANSFVVSSGSTLGASNGVPFRVWVQGCNDAGTFRIGVFNAKSGFSIARLSNDRIQSSTAEGGAGGADSAQVLYTGTAVTDVACVVLGYFNYSSGLTTAGTYDVAPTGVQLFGVGIPLPGVVVQTAINTTSSFITSTCVAGVPCTPFDNTIPQAGEGTTFISQAITPTATMNILRLTHEAYYAISANSRWVVCFMFNGVANALKCGGDYSANANTGRDLTLRHFMNAGQTTSLTIDVQGGAVNAGILTFCGSAGADILGGVLQCQLMIEEIQGALPEITPDNDNDPRLLNRVG